MAKSFGIVGAGSMGRNHARTIANLPESELDVVVDSDLERAKEVAAQYGGVPSAAIDSLAECDAVVVASSTPSHFQVASTLLERGTPVLLEKPLATSLEESRRLVELSEQLEVPLMCGFVERHNPVVVSARALLEEGEAIFHISTKRHSPVTPRSLGSVTWDLLIHDIDLVLTFLGGLRPSYVHGVTTTGKVGGHIEIADAVLKFPNAVASLSSSRLGHRKVRDISITTDRRLIELDLLRQTLTTFQNIRQEQVLAGMTSYRAETVVDIPFVRHSGEPLELQLKHFLKLMDDDLIAKSERDSILMAHEIAEMVDLS